MTIFFLFVGSFLVIRAQVSCSLGCVAGSCAGSTCPSPVGHRVCFQVDDLRFRDAPSLSANILGKWKKSQKPTITAGPRRVDNYDWFQFDSSRWSAFGVTEMGGKTWFYSCAPPPSAAPTPSPTPAPVTPSPTPPKNAVNPDPGVPEPSRPPLPSGSVCYESDACCNSSGQFKQAGEPCVVAANDCTNKESTCSGNSPSCKATFKSDGSPCNGGTGKCRSGQCKAVQAVNCGKDVLETFMSCSTKCHMSSAGAKVREMCLCDANNKPSSSCWQPQRVEDFVNGKGADVAMYKAMCPQFCGCKCKAASQMVKENSAGSLVPSLLLVLFQVAFQ